MQSLVEHQRALLAGTASVVQREGYTWTKFCQTPLITRTLTWTALLHPRPKTMTQTSRSTGDRTRVDTKSSGPSTGIRTSTTSKPGNMCRVTAPG